MSCIHDLMKSVLRNRISNLLTYLKMCLVCIKSKDLTVRRGGGGGGLCLEMLFLNWKDCNKLSLGVLLFT